MHEIEGEIQGVACGLVPVSVAPAGYAQFEPRGDPRQLDRTVNYNYSSWLPRSGYRHSGAADIEIYGADYQPDCEQSLMYYAIALA